MSIIDKTSSFFLCFIIFIIPILVFHKNYHLSIDEQSLLPFSNKISDFYYFYRQRTLLTISFFLLIIFIFRIIKYSLEFNIYYYLIIGIVLFIVSSAFFSKHIYISWNGYYYMLEGALVLLSYFLLVVISMNVLTENRITHIISSIYFVTILVLIIGFFQIFNLNFSHTFWKLISNSTGDIISFGKNIDSTFGNSNYLGCFLTLTTPFIFINFFLEKNTRILFLKGLISFLSIFIILESNSRSAILGSITFIILFSIFFRHFLLVNKKKSLFSFIFLFLIFPSFYFINKSISTKDIETNKKEKLFIKNIDINTNLVTIHNNYKTFSIKFFDNKINIFDLDNNLIPFKVDSSGKANGIHKVFDYFKIILGLYQNHKFISIAADDIDLNFILKKNSIFYLNPSGKLVNKITNPESIGFHNKEELYSGRGFIWSRTFPLLRKCIFFGYGANNLAFYFPQDDYVGKLNTFKRDNVIVEKPHSMYLEFWLSNGLLSLILLLVFFIIYISDSINLYKNLKVLTRLEIYGITNFISILSTLSILFFNDSMLGYAPLFWILIGTGVFINDRVKRIKKLEGNLVGDEGFEPPTPSV